MGEVSLEVGGGFGGCVGVRARIGVGFFWVCLVMLDFVKSFSE